MFLSAGRGGNESGLSHTYVVHYSEVALKGNNRPEFVRSLRRNIRRALLSAGDVVVESKDGRLLVNTNADEEEACRALSKVFGVAWFSRADVVESEYRKIREAVLSRAHAKRESTFRIVVRRTDKSFSPHSMEMERRLGEEVIKSTGMRVDLSHPAESVHVDIIRGRALVYSDKTQGPGGLPVGTAGRVVHLFSGGIDSPVAAWLLMKRGCTPVYLHFYLAPTPAYVMESKVLRLVKILSVFSGKSTLLLVPFANYQLATAEVPNDLEPSLFRRFMRITAEILASRFGASAISTGDCLSQAASQTLWNLRTFDSGSSLLVLRPLLSYDKNEVIQLARRIGTYEPSIEEYRDCCAIITRHPRTRSKNDLILRYSDRLRFKELAEASLRGGTLVTYNPVSGGLKVAPLAEVNGQPPEASLGAGTNHHEAGL
jgi:thiamine biosynthesis protein ThiI